MIRKAEGRYDSKRFWQSVHKAICKPFGRALRLSRCYVPLAGNGGINEMRTPRDISPVSYDEGVDQSVVDRDTAAAIDFVKRFAQGKCVILTMVPSVETKIAKANAIAKNLGVKAGDAWNSGGSANQRWISPGSAERRTLVPSFFSNSGARNSLVPRKPGRSALLKVPASTHRSTDGSFLC